MEYILYGILILVAICVIWFLCAHVLKKQKPKAKEDMAVTIDLDAFIDALGGKDNIKDVQATNSKVTVILQDETIDIDALKELGASGIVQGEHKVTIILGKMSKNVAKGIQNRK